MHKYSLWSNKNSLKNQNIFLLFSSKEEKSDKKTIRGRFHQHTAFTLEDPPSKKMVKSSVSFWAFWIFAHKSWS